MARNAKSKKNLSTSNDSNANNANYNENDRKRLYEINNTENYRLKRFNL